MHSLLKTGIGLRAPHVRELLATKVDVGFLEAHSENYFGGGKNRKDLCSLAQMYPISLHGVGLSLGRADGLDDRHLKQLKNLIDVVQPVFVSEHLSWSAYQHIHVPDLLPLPFTKEALSIFAEHIDVFQETIGRQILVENPSNYLAFADLDYSEPEFLNLLVERTGCALLLDINNIAVSAHNLGYDAKAYIDAIPADSRIQQFHLAGYQINHLEEGETVYIDTHGQAVYPEVWELYTYALQRFGDVPTLIEWDTDIPALDVLCAEADKAEHIRCHNREKYNALSA